MSDIFTDYRSGDEVRIAFDQTGRVLYGKFVDDECGKARIQMDLTASLDPSRVTGRYAMLVDYVYVKPAAAKA